jgi:hypothetical protein
MIITPQHLKRNQFLFLDGKRVAGPWGACSREEGWVDLLIPVLPKEVKDESENVGKEDIKTESDWEVRRVTGKVEIRALFIPGTTVTD